uniref:Uncharacterized protein n=1 Tax=Arundo donax TaxID=35708 RepID=A0A0A9G1R3_ARUDO
MWKNGHHFHIQCPVIGGNSKFTFYTHFSFLMSNCNSVQFSLWRSEQC